MCDVVVYPTYGEPRQCGRGATFGEKHLSGLTLCCHHYNRLVEDLISRQRAAELRGAVAVERAEKERLEQLATAVEVERRQRSPKVLCAIPHCRDSAVSQVLGLLLCSNCQIAISAWMTDKYSDRRTLTYYLRRDDGLIKIGRTTALVERFASLQREHGTLVLLAWEPGHGTETFRHRQFSRARVIDEWFEPVPELLALIASMPDWSALTYLPSECAGQLATHGLTPIAIPSPTRSTDAAKWVRQGRAARAKRVAA